MNEREALKLALAALEHEAEIGNDDAYRIERDAIKQVLAQPEQEPVAWRVIGTDHAEFQKHCYHDGPEWSPLYDTPPQRTWVGLTDDEIAQAMFRADVIVTGPTQFAFARDLEAKLKEKNT